MGHNQFDRMGQLPHTSSLDFASLPKDGARFESLVAHLLEAMGYRILEKPAVGPEGGRDILVERKLRDVMGEARERVVVQCKHHARSGRAVGDNDLGAWQNAITRYQARGYLLVTDTYVTENVSRAFRSYTEDPANFPKWATFWDVDELSSHLWSHAGVRRTFFPTPFPHEPAGVRQLLDEVSSWATAIGYSVTNVKDVDTRTAQILAAVRHGGVSATVLIHCVGGELTPADVLHMNGRLDHSLPVGWVISETRISQSARQLTAQLEGVSVFTLAEFLETLIWAPYFRALRDSFAMGGLSTGYVDPSGYRIVENQDSRENGEYFDSLEQYVNRWLREGGNYQLLLLGDYGSGKSSFCKHYAIHQLNRFTDDPSRERMPLLLPLRELQDMTSTQLLTDAMVHLYRLPFVNDVEAVFNRLAAQRRLLIIADGFDESMRWSDRDSIGRAFQCLKGLCVPGNKVLITSRTRFFQRANETYHLFGGRQDGSEAVFDQIQLAPFRPDQVEAVISQRLGEEQGTRFLTRLRASYDLMDLASKPVLLDTMIALRSPLTTESDDPVSLYLQYTRDGLVMKMKSGAIFVNSADKIFFLCELAWEMVTTANNAIHYLQVPPSIKARFPGHAGDDISQSELGDGNAR